MKFLVDMPLSPTLAAWLKEQGHGAVHAADLGLNRASDLDILARAKQEDRTIVTADLDYPRAYVVTFLQMDPLWVVDLSEPARPKVSGELEVPGWSTYIHPRGTQLVAVGVETNRTTVSLFDVANPGHPALLSRVQLGNQYSSSEANSDEKAFTVLEDAGLILTAFQESVV